MLSRRIQGRRRSATARRARGDGLSTPRLILAALVAAGLALAVGLWLAGLGGPVLGLLPAWGGATAPPPGDVTIVSEPTGAEVLLDGHVLGRTPVTLRLPGGARRLILRLAGYADLTVEATVAADRPTAVSGILWRAAPTLRQLRPPLPGGTIAGARFLADGRVALTVALPPGEERQVWIVDAAGTARRVGPAEARLAVALSPDGGRVAYAAAPPTAPDAAPGSTPVAGELWLATDGGDGPGTRRLALPASTAAERLVDLAWAPDGRHLLAAAQLRPQGGGVRTRLLRIDADADSPPVELVALPSEIVPGSWTWRSDGGQVAFVARADGRFVLCLLGTAPAGPTGAPALFRNLGELAAGQPPHAAPVTWEAAVGDLPARVAYAAPAPAAPGESGNSRPVVLYADDLAGRPPARLGGAGAGWPAWRGDGRIVAIAKGRREAIVVRVVDPAGNGGAGTSADLAALPLAWGGGDGPEVRWDVGRGRALLFRQAGWGEGGELWLIDWRDAGGDGR